MQQRACYPQPPTWKPNTYIIAGAGTQACLFWYMIEAKALQVQTVRLTVPQATQQIHHGSAENEPTAAAAWQTDSSTSVHALHC
jgi:hypothetical protein